MTISWLCSLSLSLIVLSIYFRPFTVQARQGGSQKRNFVCLVTGVCTVCCFNVMMYVGTEYTTDWMLCVPVSSRPYIVQVGMRVVMEHCTALHRVNTLLQTGSRTFFFFWPKTSRCVGTSHKIVIYRHILHNVATCFGQLYGHPLATRAHKTETTTATFIVDQSGDLSLLTMHIDKILQFFENNLELLRHSI